MRSRILNLSRVKRQDWSHGDRYRARVAWVGDAMGAGKLGFNVTEVPPGKCAFPMHAHDANEEMFFILKGSGAIRIGRRRHRIRKGDFISLPPGRASAHQIINDSKRTLTYLAVSTMEVPEVAWYSDSGKVGIFSGVGPGRSPGRRDLRLFIRSEDRVDYWEGED